MITHDMHLMLEYTDRAIVIADGELIADDKPAKVLTNEAVADRAYLKRRRCTIWRCAVALRMRPALQSGLFIMKGR